MVLILGVELDSLGSIVTALSFRRLNRRLGLCAWASLVRDLIPDEIMIEV